ncbi:hypothetical protein FACS1894137_02470 [Spirochaetia bacterium]|nr:hypothetical protein FACS1894137_02470 [Spirochaetia bacterium]
MGNVRVYLENCSYNRPYDDQNQIKIALEAQAKLYIQRLITEKKLDLVFSFVSRYENSQNPYTVKRSFIENFFKNAIDYVDQTNTVIIKKKALDIMKSNIKFKDALHLSCAIAGKCDYFITTDGGIKYQTTEIAIYNPITFIETIGGKI